MVAKKFISYEANDDFLIFASGVSNSKNTDPKAYLRESDLLKQQIEMNRGKTIVYFSTTSVDDPAENSSSYVAHKLSMEKYIAEAANQYVIFRVSNLAGKSANQNTVLNFFIHNIYHGIHFNLWLKACRNLIGLDDFYRIADYILMHNGHLNKTVNIANSENYSVAEIVSVIEQYLNKKADFEPIDRGGCFDINISETLPAINSLGINFGNNYLESILHKYYSVNEL